MLHFEEMPSGRYIKSLHTLSNYSTFVQNLLTVGPSLYYAVVDAMLKTGFTPG